MESFNVNKNMEILCESKNTRNGFKHEAIFMVNGQEQEKVKINYLNRTWESFRFESVINKLLDKTEMLSDSKKAEFRTHWGKKQKTELNEKNGMVSTIAQLGDLFGGDTKEKNDWKTRMLKAGFENQGLQMPEDWDALDENTKEKRLNLVIKELQKK